MPDKRQIRFAVVAGNFVHGSLSRKNNAPILTGAFSDNEAPESNWRVLAWLSATAGVLHAIISSPLTIPYRQHRP